MAFFVPVFALLMGIYFIRSGIRDKPPFEFMQIEKGWGASRFPNKSWAIATGIFLIGTAISIAFQIILH